MDLSVLLPLVGILVVAAGFAGILAGLFGVGGGIILVPAYFYVFSATGFDGPQLMQICLATSLASIIVTSTRSVMAHNKRGAVDWEILRTWAPGIALGAVLGVLIAAGLRSDALAVIFAVLATIVGIYLAFGRKDWRIAPQMPGTVTRAILSPVLGFLSVLMGIGGGSFGVPLMTLYSVPMHRAVATAAGFGLLIAVPSVLGFLLVQVDGAPPWTLGAVNGPAFLITICMTVLTAPLGAKLAHALDAMVLRRIFAVFILIVAANMMREALWG
ncbi:MULTISPECIES: sulfite exporter TauE/SafE family protein [unclassified Mameliella]|uniref:sulfite exporter TauE/SafE family protein n=1 Tax=unclassified Mameliella TaxID=2630630 RepID=UPI00273DFBB6|nr:MULTISPECIES: sulfite exporter TauE/SafE family protein [unclassified Mameliella]